MNNFYELAATRRSIRKYDDRPIPAEDVEYFIKAAVTAPSGCNSQCWRFVAIRDRGTIEKIAQAVIIKMEELLATKKEELTEQYFASKRKMISFFVNAPVAIAVFMTHLEYYDPVVIKALEAQGKNYNEIMQLFAYPDVLSIGAAVQNLLLAVHEKGYGACWMNEPAIAGKEITEILGLSDENRFMSLIPIGCPVYVPRNKDLKNMDEVYSIV